MPGHGTNPAGAPRAAAACPRGPQRRHPADDVALGIRDLEELERRMRAGAKSQAGHDDLEEAAQRICAGILAAFRGPSARPSAEPLYMSADGRKAGW